MPRKTEAYSTQVTKLKYSQSQAVEKYSKQESIQLPFLSESTFVSRDASRLLQIPHGTVFFDLLLMRLHTRVLLILLKVVIKHLNGSNYFGR